MTTYLESSAAAKRLAVEPESAALAAHLDGLSADGRRVVSSVLLETELRRTAVRIGIDQEAVSQLLGGLDLMVPDRALFREAGLLPGRFLRSLDALHVAAAIRLDVNEFVSYDVRQAEAARSVGLTVVSPGR